MRAMHIFRVILLTILLLGLPACAAEPAAAVSGETAATEEHHGLTPDALKVFSIGPFHITNSMILTVVVALGMIIFAQVVSRRVTPVPTGGQNFLEWMVESMYNFLGEILGPHLIKKTFWFFGSIFFFILFSNWAGLLPGVGTIGWNTVDEAGHKTFEPWLRGVNADLNMTSAMAILFFVLWTYWAIQEQGVGGFLKHIFAPKGKSEGFMKLFMIVIFLFVGVLETMSILFRPVSLSFRLYGNVFAGENILESMMLLNKWLSWLIPLPFYFLELLVGLVQALVFTLLTAVFTLLICEHEHEEGHGPAGGHGAHGAHEKAH